MNPEDCLELARVRDAAERAAAAAEEAELSALLRDDLLEELASCTWCGRLCKPNALGYCGLRCARKVLGPAADAKIAAAQDERARQEAEYEASLAEDHSSNRSAQTQPPTSLLTYVFGVLVPIGIVIWACFRLYALF